MDKRVYLLTIVSFVVGMVELIIGGILDLVATDLGISLGKAGMLITVFSLVFAIAAPILLAATNKIERKKLTLISLVVFLAGNMLAVVSPTYIILFAARIISAASGSLLVVLCITIASNIVQPNYRGRAIGVVMMGVSGSLVLGVPLGLMLGNAFGWRAPFMLISVLTVFSFLGVYFFMGKIDPKPSISLIKQLATLKNRKIFFAQLTTFLFLAGHLTLYAYLTPFLKTTMGLDGTWVSIVYLLFGVAAVLGGGIGGTFADKFGAKPTIIGVIIIFGLAIFSIPYTTFAVPVFLIVMIIWSMMSWAITPALQSYLIEAAPETSDIQQSLNNSALHFGIAFGSFLGGLVIEQSGVEHNATVGGFFVIIALATATISMVKMRSKALA
ncbi:MFS transporter [Virgibacillus halodenitrificans]|uniref:MFS transporter n=1 Tax=Virgibacillus halodenitrificans TaxID=1482 RepID=A0AAC9IUW0_VIRHA|nr:MFS transporter [Virgibacillus halodenitrificans]APC46951.1 MFS transporter [Virgibacillus halodenitrificans]MBD1222992.1 MFS transporter [Virgibacillus halodenitrificans]MCG1027455.1 MFS transporter [Virgibacillus halodenitrificans]MCJ0930251.1 MFS transporter [Virgibacillus halodenitrificans]MYL47101.1 MFS transporter [Virgibacillus halodenitrificans]